MFGSIAKNSRKIESILKESMVFHPTDLFGGIGHPYSK